MIRLQIPIPDDEIRQLRVGDSVLLTGIMYTARDAAHKYMVEQFIKGTPPPEELAVYEELKAGLSGSAIYHCGPVVRKVDGRYEFVSAGPTTSIREEVYEPDVIRYFNVKAVIGKGGMGPNTLKACQDYAAVYLHAIGGAGALIADTVKEVVGVYKLEFGVPEAFWKIRVEDFPAVVTMDSHGGSLHAEIERKSRAKLEELISKG
jgi:fumarate hydratase class I